MKASAVLLRVLMLAVLAGGVMAAQGADVITVPKADFPRGATAAMGVNLEGVVDYARSCMFVDAMKSSRKFGSTATPWDENAAVDKDGWPTGDAGAVVMADMPVKAGDYQFSCTGKCELGLINTKGTVKSQKYDKETNTTTAVVAVQEGSTNLFLSFKNTTDGVKNIKLIRPGYAPDTKEVFTKDFIKAIEPFSTLRTMDLTRTNGSDIVEWEERTKREDPLQATPKGVAWEYAIELANQTKKDLWINVPDQASEDYIKQLAKLFKENLDPERALYIEFSNEVWNFIFKQAGRNLDAAKAEVAAGDKKLNDSGKDDNQYYWGWKRVSKRTVEISNIFREVFGETAMNTRVRPVLASQSANPFMTRLQVEFIEKTYGKPSKFIYGIAGAPYLNPDEKVANKEGATAEEIVKAFDVEGSIRKPTMEYLLLARFYRLHHLCYEGGLGIEGEANLVQKVAANRDPKIANVLTDYLNCWYGQGGELFMYYNLAGMWTKYGCWGLTDDIQKLTGPKFKTVAGFAQSPPPAIAAGQNVPGVVQAAKFDANVGGGVEDSKDGGKNIAFLKDGNVFEYLLNVKEPGTYTMTVQAAAWEDAARVAVDLSGTSLGEVRMTKTGDFQKWASSDPVKMKLEKGQIVLRMKVVHAGMNIQSVTFEKSGASAQE